MKTAQQLFEMAFGTAEKPSPRAPRSEQYKAGVLNLLRYRLLELEEFPRPYTDNLTADDAYYAGVEEGWNILRREGISPEPRSLRESAEWKSEGGFGK